MMSRANYQQLGGLSRDQTKREGTAMRGARYRYRSCVESKVMIVYISSKEVHVYIVEVGCIYSVHFAAYSVYVDSSACHRVV